MWNENSSIQQVVYCTRKKQTVDQRKVSRTRLENSTNCTLEQHLTTAGRWLVRFRDDSAIGIRVWGMRTLHAWSTIWRRAGAGKGRRTWRAWALLARARLHPVAHAVTHPISHAIAHRHHLHHGLHRHHLHHLHHLRLDKDGEQGH